LIFFGGSGTRRQKSAVCFVFLRENSGFFTMARHEGLRNKIEDFKPLRRTKEHEGEEETSFLRAPRTEGSSNLRFVEPSVRCG
jgi:hypothetical protein